MTAEPLRVMPAKIAHKPAERTVTVTGTGEWSTWQATAKASFPARLLADLQSGNIDRIVTALDTIIVEHNFPGIEGKAEHMADVDPYEGLFAVAGEVFDAISRLPPR